MPSIIIRIAESIDTNTLQKIKKDIVNNLKQHGVPIVLSFTDDIRLIGQFDMKSSIVCQIDPSAATPADVSGGPILGATSGISA